MIVCPCTTAVAGDGTLKQVCGRHKPSMCVCVLKDFLFVVCYYCTPPLSVVAMGQSFVVVMTLWATSSNRLTDYRIPVENISSRVSWLAGTVDNASVIACSVHVSAWVAVTCVCCMCVCVCHVCGYMRVYVTDSDGRCVVNRFQYLWINGIEFQFWELVCTLQKHVLHWLSL